MAWEDDRRLLKLLAQRTNIPLSGGESEFTSFGCRALLEVFWISVFVFFLGGWLGCVFLDDVEISACICVDTMFAYCTWYLYIGLWLDLIGWPVIAVKSSV